jgi:hypothetical protein
MGPRLRGDDEEKALFSSTCIAIDAIEQAIIDAAAANLRAGQENPDVA